MLAEYMLEAGFFIQHSYLALPLLLTSWMSLTWVAGGTPAAAIAWCSSSSAPVTSGFGS